MSVPPNGPNRPGKDAVESGPGDGDRGPTGARSLGVVLAWLVAVAAATLVGVVAVGAIGSGILPPASQPLSQAEVDRRLAVATRSPGPPGPPGPDSTPTPSRRPTNKPPSTPSPSEQMPTGSASSEVFGSVGGTVVARCDPSIEVVSVGPLQGYRVKDIEPEDGGLRVRFESGESEVEVLVFCAGGRPRAAVEDDSDDGADDDGADADDDGADDD